MGRRRRKVIRIPKKKLPRIFTCPSCGKQAVRVEISKEHTHAVVRCGSCGITDEFDIKPVFKEVDAYCLFIDRFYKSKEQLVK